MFDGVQDQYQQFSRISLSFPLHGSAYTPSFDHPYSSSSHDNNNDHQTLDPHPILHNLQPIKKFEDDASLTTTNLLELQSERSSDTVDMWSNNEVLALLKIRSSVDNWFPDLIWEHVSRKLADLGFKRSAEKCKQKFEEETTTFNTINTTSFNNKSNTRFFMSELEEFYHGDHHQHNQTNIHHPSTVDNQEDHETNTASKKVKNPSQDNEGTPSKRTRNKRKRSKRVKFETLKCFCVDIVNKMMTQQEELHKKLLQEMLIRDEQKIAMQEALKKKEMERLNNEFEIRAREQALEGDRQAMIIDTLKKFTSNDYSLIENQLRIGSRFEDLLKIQNKDEVTSSLSETLEPKYPSSILPTNVTPKTPLQTQTNNSPNIEKNSSKAPKDAEDIGKRWPKDEVLALINIRSSLGIGNSINDQDKEKEGGAKCSLWEKISNGMLELGYKRSAKRCKEKWENINKYFRKTKDTNKKRSIESRTCPYFHQLSSLYNNQGPTANAPENNEVIKTPESQLVLPLPEKQGGFVGVVDEEKTNVTYSSSDFQL